MPDASESFDPYYKWLGIPPRDQPPNHYRLLGVDLLEEDLEVIEAAANRQMTYIQGCASGPHIALSQRLLNEISKARLALLDPSRKKKYDAQLRAELAAASPPAGETLSSMVSETDFPAVPVYQQPPPTGSRGAPSVYEDDIGTPVTILSTQPVSSGSKGAPRASNEPSYVEVREKRPRPVERGGTKVSINWRFPAFIILGIAMIIAGAIIATKVPTWLKLPPNKPAGASTTGKSR